MERCCSSGCTPPPGNVDACSQSYRFGSFSRDASRTPEACDQVWRRHLDTLRGRYLLHRFLSRIGFKDALAT
jgi:hypothetical protein